MKSQNALKLIAACTLLTGATAVFPQQIHGHGPAHAALGAPSPAANPYAGQQARDIKALSAAQTGDLLAGKGMEQAKAAELNGYPGPSHVLELAQQLELSEQQKAATEALRVRHQAEARALGAQLVQAERELDAAFSARRIDAAQLAASMQRIGQLQAALRNSHLQTHLQQTGLLTPRQVSLYAQLRGYAEPAGASTSSHPSTHID
jgi:Spy/CpxP family protein refolding chaperone